MRFSEMIVGGLGGPLGGVAFTAGLIIDLLFANEAGVFARYEGLKPGSVLGVLGKADRSRGVPFIITCGSQVLYSMLKGTHLRRLYLPSLGQLHIILRSWWSS